MKHILISYLFLLFYNFSFAGGPYEDYDEDFLPLSQGEEEIIEDISASSDGLYYREDSQSLEWIKGDERKSFPAWLSILPPLIAIFIALVFKEVHIALVLGIFFGVFTINGFQLKQIFSSFFQIADSYVLQAIAYTDGGELQTGHLSIIVFSVLIGGMVHIISKNGGMNGVVRQVSKLATSARRAQFATWLMGCMIFFDDYANSLVVGNTMRPLTDKFRVSREKLAYIVDSTAAPIAAIAFVTTWIGYQLSEIEKGLASQNILSIDQSAYSIFLGSLKYAYYPIFTLFFMLVLIYLKKDFGPMLQAEQAAANSPQKTSVEGEADKTSHWLNAAIPVLSLIFMVIIGLLITGSSPEIWTSELSLTEKLRGVLSNADSYKALIWASFLACAVAILVSLISGASGLKESMESMIDGFKTMVPAVVILILAWALAGVIENLKTADYLSSMVPDNFNAYWLPLIFFILSALISFATGSSWNTMAVMYPICIPIVIKIASVNGTQIDLERLMPVLLNTVSVILAASVFGDHCSPISDTTILSSLSSHCDHISHV
ncbi:MAG: Na+/H+ antiporter NhaC family protein, partial [Chitinophagales bacterium]